MLNYKKRRAIFELYWSLNFKLSDIAEKANVTRKTVYRIGREPSKLNEPHVKAVKIHLGVVDFMWTRFKTITQWNAYKIKQDCGLDLETLKRKHKQPIKKIKRVLNTKNPKSPKPLKPTLNPNKKPNMSTKKIKNKIFIPF